MEEEPIKSDLKNAVCEMNLLYSKMHTFSSASPTVAEESSSRYRYQNMNQRPILTTATKVQMNLNPRYISKISNNPRKLYDTSLRMRPYFIPAERSRTKSENAVEPSSTLPNHSTSLYSDDLNGETLCDASAPVRILGPPATSAMDCDGAFEMNGNAVSAVPTVSGVLNKSGGKLNDGPKFLKKSKSLEDIYSASAGRGRKADGSQPSHEMEFVSSRIKSMQLRQD